MPTQLNEGDLILLTRSTDTNHDVIAYKVFSVFIPTSYEKH